MTSSSVAATPGCSQSPQSHDPLTSPSFSTCTSSTSHILTPTLKPSTLQTDTLPSAEGTPHPASSNRPSHIQTNPLPLANRPSHPRTEHRPTTSPCSHSTSISPHRLQGMRTRHHFSEEYSYIIDAKDKGNIGRYVNVRRRQTAVSESPFMSNLTYKRLESWAEDRDRDLSRTVDKIEIFSFNPSISLSYSIAAHRTCLFRMYLWTRTTFDFPGWPSLPDGKCHCEVPYPYRVSLWGPIPIPSIIVGSYTHTKSHCGVSF